MGFNDSAPSTAEVLYLRTLEVRDHRRYVEWAEQMLIGGSDSPCLRILAGESDPVDLQLIDRTFQELEIRQPETMAEIGRAFASARIQQLLDGAADMGAVLHDLCDLCIRLDYARDLYDFYRLHFAYDDLEEYGNQHDWADATAENIGAIVLDRCRTWLRE